VDAIDRILMFFVAGARDVKAPRAWYRAPGWRTPALLAFLFFPMIACWAFLSFRPVPGLQKLPLPFYLKLLVGPAIFAIMIFGHGLYRHRKRRFIAALRRAEFNLCTNCGYDLRGAGPSGQCPECSAGYNRSTTEFIWRRWARDLPAKNE
jgi:hypothetical protein